MSPPLPLDRCRAQVRERVLAFAREDPRVIGLVDYGSASEGRGDRWSDLDLSLFFQDEVLPAFQSDWKRWAASLGPLLHGYISGVGHPWTFYDARPLPLRVDFNFLPARAIETLPTWPNAPLSVEAMVLYDGSGGRLSAAVAPLVGRRLAPSDPAALADQVAGDFFYYLLRVRTLLLRDEWWAARHEYHAYALPNLYALLRLAVGRTPRWGAVQPAVGLARDLSPAWLAALEMSLPDRDPATLLPAMRQAADLGAEAAAEAARRLGSPSFDPLAHRIRVALADPDLR